MAGAFDVRPPRDVLTSILNGVSLYTVVEEDEKMRRERKREKRGREKERRKAKAAAKVRDYTTPLVHGHLITALERPGWNLAKQSYAIGMKEGSTPRDIEVNLESNVYGGVETSPRELMWVIVAAITQRDVVRKVLLELGERREGRGGEVVGLQNIHDLFGRLSVWIDKKGVSDGR